jgi:predicted small secreted protein
MKKNISILLMLVLSVCLLAGCGGGPDLTEVTKKYNQAADIFNEAAELVNANGWIDDAEFLAMHNGLADEIEQIKAIIEDPEQAKNIDVDVMSADLDGLIQELQAYKEAVSVPLESSPDLTEVTKKYNQAADIFNEAAELVNANGWIDDAEFLEMHNGLADEIEQIKAIIADPEQSKNIDVDVMSADLDGLIQELQAYKEAVSVPLK